MFLPPLTARPAAQARHPMRRVRRDGARARRLRTLLLLRLRKPPLWVQPPPPSLPFPIRVPLPYPSSTRVALVRRVLEGRNASFQYAAARGFAPAHLALLRPQSAYMGCWGVFHVPPPPLLFSLPLTLLYHPLLLFSLPLTLLYCLSSR